MKENYPELKLENQICFRVYRLNRAITNHYRPFLNELDLTYPQYLVMMALWEKDGIPVNSLSEILKLDTGTLSPLLKRLEATGYIQRKRSKEDERTVIIKLTKVGAELQKKALEVPHEMAHCLDLSEEEYLSLRKTLDSLILKAEQR
jgi:Transcriptional regulators